MTGEEITEMKRKFSNDLPFSEEERKKILGWKIMDTLEQAGGEISMGELYKKLGIANDTE